MKGWNKTLDVDSMLLHIDDAAPDRTLRLLAAGFCRHIEHLVSEARCRDMIAQAKLLSVFSLGSGHVPEETFLLDLLSNVEKCADGAIPADVLATPSELAETVGSYTSEFYYACYDDGWGDFNHALIGTCKAAMALYEASKRPVDIARVASYAAQAVYRAGGGSEQQVRSPGEVAAQCNIIRDVSPRPKRKVKLRPSWLTTTVVALATGIYQERAFDRMPILADALQDAGCDDEDVLNHCRSEGPHVRGCWAVDLLLGKS